MWGMTSFTAFQSLTLPTHRVRVHHIHVGFRMRKWACARLCTHTCPILTLQHKSAHSQDTAGWSQSVEILQFRGWHFHTPPVLQLFLRQVYSKNRKYKQWANGENKIECCTCLRGCHVVLASYGGARGGCSSAQGWSCNAVGCSNWDILKLWVEDQYN